MSNLKKLGFLCGLSLYLTIGCGYLLGGAWNFLTIFYVFVLLPILDQLIGKDPYNIPAEEEQRVAQQAVYQRLLYGFVLLHLAAFLWGTYVFSMQKLTLLESIGLGLSIGVLMGSGINIAHELGHKNEKTPRFFSKLLLLCVAYMHFFIEHNRGHHVHVATPQDPATSRKGENFYRFWFRTVSGSYRSAWQLEKRRLQRKQKPFWSTNNQMLWFSFLPILLFGSLTFFWSWVQASFVWQVPVYLIGQSVVAFTLLEAVNYIEHYGMLRQKISENRYEAVTPLHSWNANHLVSNWFLFQLQRHSDHHAYTSRPYQVLRHFEESPQLPSGYPSMILLALFPPFWFSIMDKRLAHWREARAM